MDRFRVVQVSGPAQAASMRKLRKYYFAVETAVPTLSNVEVRLP